MGRSGIAGIGISGATGMPFANGTLCCALAVPSVANRTQPARHAARESSEVFIVELPAWLIFRARTEHDAIANELRHQPFFFVLRRQPRVHHAHIRLIVWQRVREEQTVAP